MRIATVIGRVVLNKRLDSLAPGQLLIAEAMDADGLSRVGNPGSPGGPLRKSPMPQSLVVLDRLGAGLGQRIAVSEGREATAPFYPGSVPIDAYCAAILDNVEWNDD